MIASDDQIAMYLSVAETILHYGAAHGHTHMDPTKAAKALSVRHEALIKKHFSDMSAATHIDDKKRYAREVLETALALAKGEIEP
jgi:hypothetical protein